METKHMPGPWEWVKRKYYSDLVGANGVIVISDGSAGGEYRPDLDVTGPDARLIAAAPDLLEAIEVALIYLEDGAPKTAADRLRAAIAKATGGE